MYTHPDDLSLFRGRMGRPHKNDVVREEKRRERHHENLRYSSFFFVGRTFFSFGSRMIVSVTVCEREGNRRNPALLSSSSILVAVTTSLFPPVSSFSSLILSTTTIAHIAYAIE